MLHLYDAYSIPNARGRGVSYLPFLFFPQLFRVGEAVGMGTRQIGIWRDQILVDHGVSDLHERQGIVLQEFRIRLVCTDAEGCEAHPVTLALNVDLR